MKKAQIRIQLASAGVKPPSEFRIFKAGVNKTSKGDFVFDQTAAESVMAAYQKAGVDVMIDLEHLSLDSSGANFDPDAYGWCALEVRNGELWATNVRWTPEGARRLSNRSQRYISPAFMFFEETNRVSELYNIAICAIPATYEAPALVAASKRTGQRLATLSVEVSDNMELSKIALALGLDKEATIDQILEAIATLQDDDGDPDMGAEAVTDDMSGSDEEKTEKALSKAPKLLARIMAAVSSKPVLEKRLESIEQKTEEQERTALLLANANKIPKSLEAYASKLKPEVLKEFLSALPAPVKPAEEPRAVASTTITLTDEDKRHCLKHGVKEEDFLAHKVKLANDDARRRAL